MCKRGDIYYVDFGDYDGSKQGGIRPALIVSNNMANKYSQVVTVVPLTGRANKRLDLPTHVLIPKNCGSGLSRDSLALTEQVDSIDKSQLREYRGHICKSVMQQVTDALLVQLAAV